MLKFKIAVFIFTIAASMCLKAQELNVYLFPGQGSDYRIFDSLQLEKRYILHYMHYAEPNKKETLSNYSNAFSSKIDTTNPFILIGVSFGGMICVLVYWFQKLKFSLSESHVRLKPIQRQRYFLHYQSRRRAGE